MRVYSRKIADCNVTHAVVMGRSCASDGLVSDLGGTPSWEKGGAHVVNIYHYTKSVS